MAALSIMLLLSGCAPNFQKQEEVVQQKDNDTKEKAIIPKYKISDQYYRTIMPFEAGKARGLVVNNLNTRYDIHEFETGLMRVAQNNFDANQYVFKEGQYLDSGTVRSWLNRKYTEDQLKEQKLDKSDNLGLNPEMPSKGKIEELNKDNPIYLAHILEHNYLVPVQGEKSTYQLGGVVIGLALNTVHYYQKEAYGATFEEKIPREVVEREGKKIAEQVLSRLRGIDELKDVPITIAMFEQKNRTSVIPGNFFAYSHVPKGSSNLGDWENIDEKYVLFPSDNAKADHREDWTLFENFRQDVETYFPNFSGVVGRAFYAEGQMHEMRIDIPIQLYGKAEVIGFTQYVTGLVMERFPDYIAVEVTISSVNGEEALVVRKQGEDEPIVHVYQ
nr:CamS family sex pheromone protein [Mesobacillus harenae]